MTYLASSNRYDAMQYRRCGNSGLKLPAISLGLWHNFGGVDIPEHYCETQARLLTWVSRTLIWRTITARRQVRLKKILVH